MDKQIVKFFLSLADSDDAEARTCAKFNISEETLMFMLEADLVNSMMETF